MPILSEKMVLVSPTHATQMSLLASLSISYISSNNRPTGGPANKTMNTHTHTQQQTAFRYGIHLGSAGAPSGESDVRYPLLVHEVSIREKKQTSTCPCVPSLDPGFATHLKQIDALMLQRPVDRQCFLLCFCLTPLMQTLLTYGNPLIGRDDALPMEQELQLLCSVRHQQPRVCEFKFTSFVDGNQENDMRPYRLSHAPHLLLRVAIQIDLIKSRSITMISQ